MPPDFQAILPHVIDAALEAGRMVAAEFARPDGPRFSDHVTAPLDTEIELMLRDRLLALVPARFVGEEAGVLEAPANGYCWVVDPHDGTRAFLEGKRGSAVSVALLLRGVPILAVVYAPTSPDRGPDLISWAEGGPIVRNGAEIHVDLRERDLAAGDVVFLNHGAWQRPVWHGTACAPAGFMPLPSIAYRLARLAVGDGIATLTLRPVNALDIAAGHALLMAAGGVLVAEDGVPVVYDELGQSRPSACFGGAPRAVEVLRNRTWRGSQEPRREPRETLTWPRLVPEAMLDRAAGCLFGQVIGDSLGSLVEFQSAADIARRYPHGVTELRNGGTWNTLAGQPTDDSELALGLARTLIGAADYDPEAVATAYGSWLDSGPFDCGTTTRRALGAAARAPGGTAAGGKAAAAQAAADASSQSNGSLMRIAPIGIWARTIEQAAAAAMADSALSHPHPVCRAACAAQAAAINAAINGADAAGMLGTAIDVARAAAGGDPVVAVLLQARRDIGVAEFQHQMGWVLTALHNAFFHLAAGSAVEAALIRTVGAGGDTDTNAAIAGALLGSLQGRAAFPTRWVMPMLACRPDGGLPNHRPRPEAYWPDDLVDLAEALLPCPTSPSCAPESA